MNVAAKWEMVCPKCRHIVEESPKYWRDPYEYDCSYCGERFPAPEKFFPKNEIKRKMLIFREMGKAEDEVEATKESDEC